MTLRDMIAVSLGNLRRLKLRTFLTSAGVLIAIAAFVSMLSFGAGNQKYVEKEFNELGLFTTMQVYPKKPASESDTTTLPKLDAKALEQLSAIPGVNLVYPYDAFSVKVKMGDSIQSAKAQALSSSAIRTKLISNFVAGRGFDSSSSREVIVSEDLGKKLGFAHPDSIIGKALVVSIRVSTLDSAFSHVLVDKGVSLLDRAKRIHYDSLLKSAYRTRVVRTEANELVRRFVSGFMDAQKEIADSLIVCGVRKSNERMGRLHVEDLIIPLKTGSQFKAGGMSNNPVDIFSAMTQGTLFSAPEDANQSYSQATIDFDPRVPYKNISEPVEKMGYRVFSFAAEFEQIQQVFLYFDLGLALIGLIALTTASLGIVNTMVMSILERRKEIGILKSLGADDRDIRVLFLCESGVIGLFGTIGGIVFGWMIARIASAIAQAFMESKGIPPIDLFALPLWLVLIALAVGTSVSVLAGYYPAARASRVDPVEALRNE